MVKRVPLEDFIKTYQLNPTESTLSIKLESVILLLQTGIERPYFTGKISLNTLQNFKILEHLSTNIFKNPDIQFDTTSKSVRCTIIEGRTLIKQCLEVLGRYQSILEQIKAEKLAIWKNMEQQPFIDTRAIYQACTTDSKKAPIQEIISQIRAISSISLPNLENAVLKKVTPTPVFLWARHDLDMIVKVREQIYAYTFKKGQKFYYIPLSGKLESVNTSKIHKLLIIENLDTAFAMSFMESYHNYDVLLCAGGQGNSGSAFQSFLLALRGFLSEWPLKWIYFGDYDMNGFTIYQALRDGIRPPLKDDLEFLSLPIHIYKKYLLLFGKDFPNNPKDFRKKVQYYLNNLEKSSIPLNMQKIFHLNLDFHKELEQNILIYCREGTSNRLIIE